MNVSFGSWRPGATPLRDSLVFIGLTIVLSWLFWIPGGFLQANGAGRAGDFLVAIGSFAPLAVAFYLNLWVRGRTFNVGRWLRTLTLNNVLVAAVLPVLVLTPIILLRLYVKTFDLGQFISDLRGLPFILPAYLILAFGEETGWRGYLLERLDNYKLILANSIIAFAWFFWQIPLILAQPHDVFLGDAGQHLAAFLLFSILITPFFNRLSLHSNMNVLLPTILRACLNAGFFAYSLQTPVDLLAHPMGVGVLLWLAALNVLLFGQLWQGKPSGVESELSRVMPLEPAIK